MTTRKSMNKPLVFLLLFCLCLQANGQTTSASPYPDAPPALEAAVARVAEQIVRKNDAEQIDSQLPTILFYTLADAMAEEGDRITIRSIKAYEYLGETARTDKQIGASTTSEGTTSASEKPGFADLLGFAIEHGAIQQEVDDTSLTLSTTPYAFVALANEDSAETYKKYAWLRAANLSANFSLSEGEAPPLADARGSQLNEWSVKLRLTPERSSRSEEFQTAWRVNAKPKIVER
ncbi:MAG TPA: hypothetical protein VNI02_15690, partial [Blastocatellia bacterium]|nr:hypothetical protein [Blastocatellia bacterium]